MMLTGAADPALASDEASRARVLGLLRLHGWNATSFQALEPGLSYFFDEEDEACVAYVETGGAWVVAGAPIAAEERLASVARRFEEEAARRGRRVRYFAVEARFLERTSLSRLRIGEQPSWDPGAWGESLRGSRNLREQLRRSRAKGVRVRLLSPWEVEDPGSEVRRGMEALIERWMRVRQMAPMGFLVAIHPFPFGAERRYFVAERGGAVVGFLAAIPIYARDGWFFEDLLRDPHAPNGTAELLVDASMRSVAEEGCPYVTLGLAPLAGVSGWLRAAGRLGRSLYDFGGIRRFKARLRPQRWEPIFLAWPSPHPMATHSRSSPPCARLSGARESLQKISALVDSLAAFARGGLLRFGALTLLRVPTLVIQGLAVLLVPWTAALALARSSHWFPSPLVKWSWVGFDLILCAGLFSLARRWRPWLGALLASAVTLDAALTWLQALAFNAPRIEGPLEVAVTALGVMAPTVAAPLLWRAHRRRSLPAQAS